MNYLICALVYIFISLARTEMKIIEIRMPNATTKHDDAYVCTSHKLENDERYIINIKPLAQANKVHHMFAFGCMKPGSDSTEPWLCKNAQLNPCMGRSAIIFAWGRDAPSLTLPSDVSFTVGPDSQYEYIVINVHYLHKVENDFSGLEMTFVEKPRLYEAGILFLAPWQIAIPPKVEVYASNFSCKYRSKPINIFAVRVHAHMHGDANSAYLVRNGEWNLIIKSDPQWPQAFYPLKSEIELKDGDYLVGRCVYHNDEDRTIYAGDTHSDEMCNVYLMYYVEKTKNIPMDCAGNMYPTLEAEIPSDSLIRPLVKPNFPMPVHNHANMAQNESNKTEATASFIKQLNIDSISSIYEKLDDLNIQTALSLFAIFTLPLAVFTMLFFCIRNRNSSNSFRDGRDGFVLLQQNNDEEDKFDGTRSNNNNKTEADEFVLYSKNLQERNQNSESETERNPKLLRK